MRRETLGTLFLAPLILGLAGWGPTPAVDSVDDIELGKVLDDAADSDQSAAKTELELLGIPEPLTPEDIAALTKSELLQRMKDISGARGRVHRPHDPRYDKVAARLRNEFRDIMASLRYRFGNIHSRFYGGRVDGWTLPGGELLWQPSEPPVEGGSDDSQPGFLSGVFDVDGKTAYYVAPDKFHRDLTEFELLRVELRSAGGTYFTRGSGLRGDVWFANEKMFARYSFDRRPADVWDTFEIPLEDNGKWVLGGGARNLADVLREVTGFQIRAEYGTSDDSSGLKDVLVVRRGAPEIAPGNDGETNESAERRGAPLSDSAKIAGPEPLTSEAIAVMTRHDVTEHLIRIAAARRQMRRGAHNDVTERLKREFAELLARLRSLK